MDSLTRTARRIAVIFDMDGVMLDTEAMMRRAWQEAARGCGTTIDDQLYSRFIGLGTQDSDHLLRAIFGEGFPLAHFYQLATLSFEKCIATYGIPLKAGLLELLNVLDCNGYPRAVATSTDYNAAVKRLDVAGLLPRVDHIVAGDQVPHAKPAPDIFLRAAQLLEVPPSDCLVLEDSAPGIQAALAAGMSSIFVPDLTQATPGISEQASAVVESLYCVVPIVQGLSSSRKPEARSQ